jgi:transcriptional regulator with XRE-family HTH domain
MEDYLMRLSKKLASARKQRHMSLGMASRYSGIPKSTLWRYEEGRSRIPADAVAALAKLYGISVAQVLDGEDRNV